MDETLRDMIFFWLVASRSLLPMALASFPGSGNTWTRYLIEGATGIFTGSVYMDMHLKSKGFYGETAKESCGCTLVQKTHGYTLVKSTPNWRGRMGMVARHGRRAVLVVRNPYEALLALRNFAFSGHVNRASDKRFTGTDWNSFVTVKAALWRDFYMDWLNFTTLVHVIHYENLKVDPVLEMRNFVRFIGLPEDENRLTCLTLFPDGQFKRKHTYRQIFQRRDVFSSAHHQLLHEAIDSVQAKLTERGLPPLPLPLYKYYSSRHDRHHLPASDHNGARNNARGR